MATIPRQNDVLFGKGTAINTHHGNKHYRSIVELQKSIFLQSKRKEKREIAKNIIHQIEELGGRFLMEDPNSNKKGKMAGDQGTEQVNPDRSDGSLVTDPLILARAWVPVGDDRVVEKVMHRLREKRASVGQMQPEGGENLEPQPPDMAVYKSDTAAGVAAGTQLDAANSSHNSGEGRVASNTSGHYETDNVASETNTMMSMDADVPATRRIQSTLLPQAQQTPNLQGGAPSPVPVSFKYWIKSTCGLSSKDVYLETAVSLAYMLTKRLIHIVTSANMPPEEISSEKVIVFVQVHHLPNSSNLSIKAVHFHFETQIITSLLQPTCPLIPGSPLQSRAFCTLLGNILLELFTMGRSSSLGIFSGTHNSFGINNQYGLASVDPPPQKRRAVIPTSDPVSSRANNLLVESGMPLSIRRLVCDLLVAMSEPCPPLSLTSLDQALWDLAQMVDHPKSFLFNRCPLKALSDTCLFTDIHRLGREQESSPARNRMISEGRDRLFGREREMDVLLRAKKEIEDRVLMGNASCNNANGDLRGAFATKRNLLCETIFLSGYAGSGKSSVLRSLAHACEEDGWFVLRSKYDKQTESVQVVSKSLDDFFGMWASKSSGDCAGTDPAMIQSFQQLCDSIKYTIDEEGLKLTAFHIPNLRKVVEQPSQTLSSSKGPSHDQGTFDRVGSAKKRRMNLLHVLFKSLCSSGRPVLVILDDLQWASSLEGMEDFLDNYANVPCGNPCGNRKEACHGLLIAGAYRSNEVGENDDMIKTINSIEQSGKAKVTKLSIGEMAQKDIRKLLSAKLCLPIRYTQTLAGLVHSKSRGNPFFIVQFIKSIIANRMLEFSINSDRWIWDCDVIDMQMISDEVAALLTTRFNQLPLPLMQTLKIVSCFGSQIECSILTLLNLGGQVTFNIQDVLHLAVNEGLMEKAGPIYQFTHDIIQQTIYELIPPENRKLLHRSIGTSLLQSSDNNPDVLVPAVEQINISCKGAALSTEERSSFAKANAIAAKTMITESSFEKARSYIDAGMQLLEPHCWEKQYSLCLQLYEMSSSVSFMHGDVRSMSNALNEIIANVKSFEDSLTSSSLLAKLLASSSRYKEAMSNCLSVLSNLGEEISPDVSLPFVQSELAVLQTTLANITVEQVKELPPMTDQSKLNAMKFLSLVCMYSLITKPILLPLFSCRMVRLTIEYGFCDASIVGLALAGYGLFLFLDDIRLGYQIGKVCDSLIEENPNKHALRSSLYRVLDCILKAAVEPSKTVIPLFQDRYNSAMLSGDVENAMSCFLSYCTLNFYSGTNLVFLSKIFISCIEQSAKYKQINTLHVAMANFRGCIHLTGRSQDEVGIKNYKELEEIGKNTSSNLLLWRIFMSQIGNYFYERNWIEVMELSEKQPPSKFKRLLVTGQLLYEGVASLTLARQTHQLKWRKIGEEAVQKMNKWAEVSEQNFLWLAKVLQAELHYLNGNLKSAETSYIASIASACDNQHMHHEAAVYELYGIFCIENGMVDKGFGQLRKSLEKYEQWGALKKANDLKLFMAIVDPTSLRKLKITI